MLPAPADQQVHHLLVAPSDSHGHGGQRQVVGRRRLVFPVLPPAAPELGVGRQEGIQSDCGWLRLGVQRQPSTGLLRSFGSAPVTRDQRGIHRGASWGHLLPGPDQGKVESGVKYVRRNLWPRIRVVNRASSFLQTPYPLSTRRWNLPFSSSSTSSSWSAYRLTKRRQSASGEHSQGPRPDSVKSPFLQPGAGLQPLPGRRPHELGEGDVFALDRFFIGPRRRSCRPGSGPPAFLRRRRF